MRTRIWPVRYEGMTRYQKLGVFLESTQCLRQQINLVIGIAAQVTLHTYLSFRARDGNHIPHIVPAELTRCGISPKHRSSR